MHFALVIAFFVTALEQSQAPDKPSTQDPPKVKVEVVGSPDTYKVEDSATATRVATPLRDTPQTLTVVPRSVLLEQNAQSLGDAVRSAPGVTVAQGEGNRDQIVMRGLGTSSDFFVNGIRDDQERFRDLYNVERVEVLEGPAAVLFGRGGAGGVVNLVTRRPARRSGSNASLEAGSFGHRRATTQLTVPAGSRAVFGLNAMGEDSRGFRDGFFLRRYAANPTFEVQLGARSRLFLGVEHMNDHRRADRGIPSAAGRPAAVPARQFFGSRSRNDARSGVNSTSAVFEHIFAGGIVLRNNFLAGRYDKFYANVYPNSAVTSRGTVTLAAYDHTLDRTNAFNQTDLVARTRVGGMEHVLLAGVEAGRQVQDETRHTAAPIADVPLTDSTRDVNFATAPVAINRDAASVVFAAYVQDQVQIASRWKAVAGARIDRFDLRVNDALASGAASRLSRVDRAVSPRAGLIFQPSPFVSLYASYSSTFLPSGQTLGLAVNTAQLEPESATNYEVGSKADIGRVQVAASVFRLDRDNVKSTDPGDVTKLVLTGQQRADGLSISAAGDAGPVKIQAAYGFLDARITRATTSGPAGRRPGLAPRNRGSVWATARVARRWLAGAGVLWQSDAVTSFTNQVILPGFGRVDGVVAYDVSRWRVALNVQNAFDAGYYATAHNDNNIMPGAPRSLQVSVRAGF